MSDLNRCPSALIIKGEHFRCDFNGSHEGVAHSNRAAESVWGEPTSRLYVQMPEAGLLPPVRVPDPSIIDEVEGHYRSYLAGGEECAGCGQIWPCLTQRLVAEIQRLTATPEDE